MTGIACGMRGCMAAVGSVDKHVTVASDGFANGRRGFMAASYGGIDNNIFDGIAITQIDCDSVLTPLNTGTSFELNANVAQNFFTSIQLQRANGTLATMLASEADIFIHPGGTRTLWNWDSHMPGVIWTDADIGFVRVVRINK